MRKTFVEEQGQKVKLLTAYDTTDIEVANKEKRKRQGRGFTKGRHGFGGNLRHVASIPLDDIVRLGTKGNMDAVMAMAGDEKAMTRLLKQHPEWRTSEGGI